MKLRYQRVSYTTSGSTGRELDRMLDYLLDASRSTAVNVRGEWRPPVDAYQTENDLLVIVELAGMDEDDIEVILFEDVLVVKGEREPALSTGAELTWYEAGIRYGKFRAEVFLPARVDAEHVQAEYQNGFLSVRLPKVSVRRGPNLVSDIANE